MTVRELSVWIKKRYKEKKGERFFSEKALLSALFERNELDKDVLLNAPNLPVSKETEEKVINEADSLLEGYPLQYYLGTEFFCQREFLVSENVLIPRPETELLVQLGAKKAEKNSKVFDFCCGSGCVGISLLLEREDLAVSAFDLSEYALELTKNNRSRFELETRLSVKKMDVLSPEAKACILSEKPSLILANPPYLTKEDMDEIDDNVKREPEMALFGGTDGLLFYRAFARYCKDTGVPFLCEMGSAQQEAIALLAKEEGLSACFYKDLFGLPRAFYLS